MNKFINQLLQLHDLELTLKENTVIHKNRNLDSVKAELEEDINVLKNNLPYDILSIYNRISRKYDIPVTPMINNTCNGCFIKLPVGIANKVQCDSEWRCCPNCSRFLYYDETQTTGAKTELHYKGLARFSSMDLMLPRIKATTMDAAIKKIAAETAQKGFVEDGKLFAKMLLIREALTPTTVEMGIAFPHARGVKACGLTLSVATVSPGIKNNTSAPISLLFVSAVPRQTSMFYLELISKLAQYFGKPENFEKIISCETPEEMWRIFVQVGK